MMKGVLQARAMVAAALIAKHPGKASEAGLFPQVVKDACGIVDMLIEYDDQSELPIVTPDDREIPVVTTPDGKDVPIED